MSSYEQIKALAKERGLTVKDLLALAPQNDPFYAGTPADIQQAHWFADLWQAAGYVSGVHLRRAHYWAVSQSPALQMPNGETYENTDRCWKFLTQASKMARYLGLVRIQDVVDRKNPSPMVNTLYAYQYAPDVEIVVPKLAAPDINVYNLTSSNAQPYHLEIWCEKSTMNDVLEPLCRRYSANLVTFEGEVSISSVYDLIKRIKEAEGKPTRIFYISDFDPAGNSMPVAMSRKIEYMLQKFNHIDWDVKVQAIVLTLDQVQRYNLPRTPIKITEKRAGTFEAAFGVGATELDALEALHPGRLAAIVATHLSDYYSQEALEAVQNMRRSLYNLAQRQVEAITAKYTAEIEALKSYLDELEHIHVEADDYLVDRFDATVEENDDDWLFDSSRTYGEQIVAYKCHKRGDLS